MKIYIRSMSEYQSKIYDNLVSASNQVNMHLIRLLLYPDSRFVDHWMHEIWSFLYRVDKLKGINKYPKAKFIRNALAVHNDTVENYIAVVKDLESELEPADVNIEDVIKLIEQYQAWIAEQLSKQGVVLQNDVKHALKSFTAQH